MVNQEMYPIAQIDQVPVGFRVPLPTKEIANAWNRQVGGKPAIDSALTASGIVGSPIHWYSISATNYPTSYSATGLPPGLRLDSVEGTILGTPTKQGSYNIELGATNAEGTATATLVFTVELIPPAIQESLTLRIWLGDPMEEYWIPATKLSDVL